MVPVNIVDAQGLLGARAGDGFLLTAHVITWRMARGLFVGRTVALSGTRHNSPGHTAKEDYCASDSILEIYVHMK